MGDILTASCTCGFSSTIFAGGGMMDFTTSCRMPALCLDCGTFTDANYLVRPVPCANCGCRVNFYNEPPLQTGNQGEEEAFTWNLQAETVILYSTPYHCPQCHEASLRFFSFGNWD